MTSFSALVVGESLVDVVRSGGTVREHVGGSAANVAVALSRLGASTSLVTRVADDERGRRVVEHLEADGVGLVGPYAAGMARTSTAVATIGAGGAATYEFDIVWDLPPVVLPGGLRPSVVHACSIGAVLAPGCEQVHALVAGLAEGAAVSYDLNLRPQVTGTGPEVAQRVEALVALADVVKASDEDLEVLDPGSDVDETARRLLTLGPSAVVVTRGAGGATLHTAAGTVAAAAEAVEVVDTVGAGDTRGAALLVALGERGLLVGDGLATLDQGGWEAALRFAVRAAAVTVSRPGADPPRRDELG
jgi:fructokinase